MRSQDKYNTEIVKDLLSKNNIVLLDEYVNVKTKMLCVDSEGYYIYVMLDNYLTRCGIGRRFDKSNDHTIDNINHFLDIEQIPFVCISDKYISANDTLKFKCKRCGEFILSPWRNVNKHDNHNRHHLLCPNCDGRNESLHASILKQMFLYYYPDTIVEDKTYVNPITNKICPTDIVNHRLKIAIEIQSQWHDFDDIKRKDKMKKDFWVNAGYQFYDPDIRHYSLLGMCQLFFPINTLPEWLDYSYGHKLNIKQIQSMLNKDQPVLEIAKSLDIHPHRIYDAIHAKKLYYPKMYKYKNFIKPEYQSQESQETAGCVW